MPRQKEVPRIKFPNAFIDTIGEDATILCEIYDQFMSMLQTDQRSAVERMGDEIAATFSRYSFTLAEIHTSKLVLWPLLEESAIPHSEAIVEAILFVNMPVLSVCTEAH